MMKRQAFEIAVALALFFTVGLAVYVVRDIFRGSDQFEITSIRVGQEDSPTPAHTAILFDNKDYSRALRHAVEKWPTFALKLKGQRLRNPDFSLSLVYFVKYASLEESKVRPGGQDACISAAILFMDAKNEAEWFRDSGKTCIPLADGHSEDANSAQEGSNPSAVTATTSSNESETQISEGQNPDQKSNKDNDRSSASSSKAKPLSDVAREAFLTALNQSLADGFEGAGKALAFHRMDDDELNLAFRSAVAKGCPSVPLISAMSDRKPAKAFDAMCSFVGDNLPEGKKPKMVSCLDERLKVAAILGNMGRSEAVSPLIALAESFDGSRLTVENAMDFITLLAPLAQLGDDQAQGYLFTLSTGHPEEVIRDIATNHLREMNRNQSVQDH